MEGQEKQRRFYPVRERQGEKAGTKKGKPEEDRKKKIWVNGTEDHFYPNGGSKVNSTPEDKGGWRERKGEAWKPVKRGVGKTLPPNIKKEKSGN